MNIKEIVQTRNAFAVRSNETRTETIHNWLSQSSQASHNPGYITENLQSELTKISEKERAMNLQFNEQLRAAIATYRDEIKAKFYSPFDKPTDYVMQIANALELIKMLGDGLSDADANKILEPFQNDYEQMSIFDRVLQFGKYENFAETFRKFNLCRLELLKADEAYQLAQSLFIGQKYQGQGYRYNNAYFILDYFDGYNEIDRQKCLLELIEKIEDSHAK